MGPADPPHVTQRADIAVPDRMSFTGGGPPNHGPGSLPPRQPKTPPAWLAPFRGEATRSGVRQESGLARPSQGGGHGRRGHPLGMAHLARATFTRKKPMTPPSIPDGNATSTTSNTSSLATATGSVSAASHKAMSWLNWTV